MCILYNFTVFNPISKDGIYHNMYSKLEDIPIMSPLYTLRTIINVEKNGRNNEYL